MPGTPLFSGHPASESSNSPRSKVKIIYKLLQAERTVASLLAYLLQVERTKYGQHYKVLQVERTTPQLERTLAVAVPIFFRWNEHHPNHHYKPLQAERTIAEWLRKAGPGYQALLSNAWPMRRTPCVIANPPTESFRRNEHFFKRNEQTS